MSLLGRNDNRTVITMLSGISTRVSRLSVLVAMGIVLEFYVSFFFFFLRAAPRNRRPCARHFLDKDITSGPRESGRGLTLINPRRDLTPRRVSKTNDGRGN